MRRRLALALLVVLCVLVAGCGPSSSPVPHALPALTPLPRLDVPAALVARLHRDYVVVKRAGARIHYDGWLDKPFDLDDLCAVVRRYVD